MTNTTLGKYQLREEIGRGGMGAVYKAYDPTLDRTVAIKLLAPHLVWEGEFVTRFLREARSAASLHHPNIITIHDVGHEGNSHFFVMDYLPGPSLKQIIMQKGHLPPAEVIAILRPLADALDYAHSKGFVHRDVKPANVMFDERGEPILTDFGIVRAAQETKLTVTGAAMGTPQYMAPEQVLGKEVDARADMYAFGVIAFELLSGKVPLDGDTTPVVLYKQVYDPPPSVHDIMPNLPAGVDAVLSQVLAKSPDKRYSTCRAFVADLANALDDAPITATAPERPSSKLATIPSEGATVVLNTAQPVQPVMPISHSAPQVPERVMAGQKVNRGRVPVILWAALAVLATILFIGLLWMGWTGYEQSRASLAQAAVPTAAPSPSVAPVLGRLTATIIPAASATVETLSSPTIMPTDLPQPTVTTVPTDVPPSPTATPVNDFALTLAPGVTMDVVRVPAGEFLMGSADSDKDAFDWEKPQHKVNLEEYFIGKYQVTNSQFATFVKATGYKTTAEQKGSAIAYNGSGWAETKGADWRHPSGPNSSIDGRDNYPVVQVSWDDAVAFCKWASQVTGRKIQLPTEAQWEKAARGTDGRLYPWGNQAPNPDQLNFNNNVKDITPVDKYSPQGDSPYGVGDMAGNEWEWTSSLWGSDLNKQTFGYPYKADDGREDPASRDMRILRGGGFDNGPKGVRAAYRGRNSPLIAFGDRGFRVVTFPS